MRPVTYAFQDDALPPSLMPVPAQLGASVPPHISRLRALSPVRFGKPQPPSVAHPLCLRSLFSPLLFGQSESAAQSLPLPSFPSVLSPLPSRPDASGALPCAHTRTSVTIWFRLMLVGDLRSNGGSGVTRLRCRHTCVSSTARGDSAGVLSGSAATFVSASRRVCWPQCLQQQQQRRRRRWIPRLLPSLSLRSRSRRRFRQQWLPAFLLPSFPLHPK